MIRLGAILAVAAGLALGACSGGSEERPAPVPVPRPRAYPRLHLYPASYRTVNLGNIALQVNDSARLSSDRPRWLDIAYPAYGITVNCTLTDVTPASLASVLDNRSERMARNLGGASAELMQWPGATVIVADRALRTPVQFLATDSATYVLSGVAVADWPEATRPDSVAPYVSAVAADITHMLQSLQ